MKQGIILLIGILISINTFANMNFIDIAKISNDSKFVTVFNSIKDNQEYYNHWSNEWNYDKPKEGFIKMLRESYSTFSTITVKNTELYLLLGDISHYLYNLDDTASYEKAVSNYNSAINASPKDYRCYWFLGYHFALSNVQNSTIDNFLKAQALLPTEEPAEFWNDYAMATAMTNMPSHCIYAMDKVKSITGKEGSFETQLGQTIYKRIVAVEKDKSYKKEDIWTVTKGEKITFTSRPLGVKILIDPKWKITVYDYKNRHSVFIINPPPLKNKKGKDIDYTIALMMKSANDNDNLDDYINSIESKYSNKSKISFSDKYGKIVAFEIRDKTVYQDIGGGHIYLIGIERSAPKYPGLLLENPVPLPEEKPGQITYYRATESNDRFKGKIFYAIMLDSCEDINEQSLSIFKTFFDNQIIIE